jgi:hypothetical protein
MSDRVRDLLDDAIDLPPKSTPLFSVYVREPRRARAEKLKDAAVLVGIIVLVVLVAKVLTSPRGTGDYASGGNHEVEEIYSR